MCACLEQVAAPAISASLSPLEGPFLCTQVSFFSVYTSQFSLYGANSVTIFGKSILTKENKKKNF